MSRGVKSGHRGGISIALPLRPPSATVHSQQLRRTERHTVWNVANGISLMACSNSKKAWFLDTNLPRTLPQWLFWGPCENLHDCISTLFISGTSLSSAQTFQHLLYSFIDFKFVSDSCHCYPCRWCAKFNPPTSLNFKNILQFSVTLSNHLRSSMIISPPTLYEHMRNDERVAMLFQCLLDHAQQKLYFSLISLPRNISKSVYINLRHHVFCLVSMVVLKS